MSSSTSASSSSSSLTTSSSTTSSSTVVSSTSTSSSSAPVTTRIAPPPRKFSAFTSFAMSAVAACTACIFTNPMEVIKTRLQLDGEGSNIHQQQQTSTTTTNTSSSSSSSSKSTSSSTLSSSTTPRVRQYTGVTNAFVSIARTEGIRGLQAGLLPALAYQITMNGCRLGFYEPMQHIVHDLGIDVTVPSGKALSGALSGGIGAILGSPLYLVKSRLQSQSQYFKAKEIHHYKGLRDGLTQIYTKEGIKGLFRGVDGALPRVMCGSATQLASYDTAKIYVHNTGFFSQAIMEHFVASLLASLLTVTVMNPLDVISTRLYQSAGKATKYTGPIDCFIQTVKREGITALQKGWLAQYARLGPHTILTFIFLEQIKALLLRLDKDDGK